MSTHWSCSESAPLHNRVNGPFDDPRQNIQSTPSSSENSPTMSSCRFSEVGEDSCHTDNPRYQKHVSEMRTFLESGPIRQLEDPQRKEGIRPHEACPINDRSEPLPNIINFNYSALLHGDESVTEGTTSPTNNTTSDLNEMMHNKFTLENDSATGDLDQEQSTGTLEAQQFFHFEAGHAYGHLPEGFQSPGDRRLSASDSGFFDERGASAQQSPFMGSPEMYLQPEWSRVGESDRQDAWTSPQTRLFHLD